MNQLKLTIDQKTFQGILDGQITEISRDVYPHNEDRYIYGEENVDENGNDVIDVRPIQYDELILTAGRGKNAPKIIVNVDKVEFNILTDENDNDITFTQDGNEYFACQVVYTLGEILK